MYEQRKSAGNQGHFDSQPGLVYEREVVDPVDVRAAAERLQRWAGRSNDFPAIGSWHFGGCCHYQTKQTSCASVNQSGVEQR
ncbi:hypothetical protein INR49_005503 [Caranx melampygus]|nr:hypothetical protein INR49_005503 [Caranx melampygus]